jgi:hypothetical protein
MSEPPPFAVDATTISQKTKSGGAIEAPPQRVLLFDSN